MIATQKKGPVGEHRRGLFLCGVPLDFEIKVQVESRFVHAEVLVVVLEELFHAEDVRLVMLWVRTDLGEGGCRSCASTEEVTQGVDHVSNVMITVCVGVRSILLIWSVLRWPV